MTTGERRLKYFEDGLAGEPLQLGLMSTSIYGRFMAHKMYLEYRAKNLSNQRALEQVSEDTRMSVETVRNATLFFLCE